ncbi:MAG: hypothetical protein HPY50_07285 [Firmicutes bacterium]|nr:hypothetical protein [Bacillota bacterium]
MRQPVIDPRGMRELMQKMKEMAPFYAPEWKFSPENPDAGTALFMIFANMYQETIKRFNQVPFKNLMAFINLLDVSLLPSRPARAYITFVLSSPTAGQALVPSGSRLSASPPDADGPVIFETESNLLVTPANLVAAYNASGRLDRITALSAAELADAKLLERPVQHVFSCPEPVNLQEHKLFLGHSSLFNIREGSVIEVEVLNSANQFMQQSYCETLANPDLVEWYYLGEEGSRPFDRVASRGSRVVLWKDEPGSIAETEVDGILNRWICCSVKPGALNQVRDIALDEIRIKSAFNHVDDRPGLAPDLAFHNDIPLDLAGHFPFGEGYGLYDTYYLASEEAFSKKGATISLRFDLRYDERVMERTMEPEIKWKLIMRLSDLEKKPLPQLFIVKVSWEYFNGDGWVKLPEDAGLESVFMLAAGLQKKMVFRCPDNLQPTRVNDQLNRWIRARVLSISNLYANEGIYMIPWLENISIDYSYPEEAVLPECGVSSNNLEYQVLSVGTPGRQKEFRPFKGLESERPCCYLGFDSPVVRGPIGLYLSLEPRKPVDDDPPLIEWDYLRKTGDTYRWENLKAIDETRGLSESGLVLLSVPPDVVPATIFGQELHWLRLVNVDAQYENENNPRPVPGLMGIYLNTIRAVQGESINSEIVGRTDGEPDKEFVLSRTPVMREEVWVDELSELSESERQALLDDPGAGVRPVLDEWGGMRGFWVKWQRVDDFYESESMDRHYLIDCQSGRIRFGNGEFGRIPPSSGGDNIEVRYSIGGGAKGNVGPLEINSMLSPIAYVNEVFNPEAAEGGCDMEPLMQAVRRGPQVIKNRNRAVTADDFEWIARQSSHDIAKIKCLPNINSDGRREAGCITLVTLLQGRSRRGFIEFKRRIEKELNEKASNIVTRPGKIRVIEPVLIEVSVSAVIGVSDLETVVLTEKEAVDKLDQFLDSLTGNRDRGGWEIGQYPHISIFYSLLNSIRSVKYVEKVSLTLQVVENGQRREITAAALDDCPHGIITNGSHRVAVKVVQ